jgi:glutathione S-transferase
MACAPRRGARAVLTVHGFGPSGNCYKVQLLLALLGTPYRWIDVDSTAGETRTPEFLAKNPNGRVPLLELDDGRCLPESNAILCYLADGTPYLPADRFERAQALQWLFFEQYSHEPYIAVARFICGWLPEDHPRRAELPRLRERGHEALAVMERHLAARDWFVGECCTVADIALYAYTHDAGRGGIFLDACPAIRGWLARVEALPGFVRQAR